MPIGTPVGSEYSPAPTFGTTRAAAVPVGTADGDILVAYAVLTQDDQTVTGFTVDAGDWVQYLFPPVPGIGATAVLMKAWASGDPTVYTFGAVKPSGIYSGTFGVVMIGVPGASLTPAVAPTKTDQAAPSTSVSCPAVTVPAGLASNALVARFYHTYYFSAAKVNTDTWTPPSGFTEYADQSDDWASIGAAALLRGAGSQAAGAATAGGSDTGAFGRGVSLVLAPAVPSTIKPRPIQRPHRAAAARAANY